MRKNVLERFLRYVKIDTQSAEGQQTVPSTQKQFDLARRLREEMESMGLKNVTLDEHCYVMGTLPANTTDPMPRIGLISHMDTSPAASGRDVRPIVWEDYDGGDLPLSPGNVLRPADSPRSPGTRVARWSPRTGRPCWGRTTRPASPRSSPRWNTCKRIPK